MRDGARLAARLWLPEDAEADPVPAVLEYIPYRRRDFTRPRDAVIHPYVAGHGYACIRVDLARQRRLRRDLARRVSGAGTAGRMRRDRLAGRPAMVQRRGGHDRHLLGRGSTGSRSPRASPSRSRPSSACVRPTTAMPTTSTTWAAACWATNLSWASVMFAYNSLPPDPEVVGARWRDMWVRASRRQRPLARDMAAPPAARRLLAAWFHRGGLCRRAMPHHGRQRLGRRLFQRRLQASGPSRRTPPRAHRSMEPQVSPYRGSGPCHRVPAGMRALVGPVAQGLGYGRHGRPRCCAVPGCRTACRRAPATTRAPGAGWQSRSGPPGTSANAASGWARAVFSAMARWRGPTRCRSSRR